MSEGELRKNPRFPSLNLVSFTSFNQKGNLDTHSYSKTLNLSEGGMLLEMRKPPDLDSLINLSLGIGENIIQVQGKIVRREKVDGSKFAVGVSFLNINEHDRKILQKYLEQKDLA